MTTAYSGGVLQPRKMIDIFRLPAESAVRKQFLELHCQPVAIPPVGGWKPNGNPACQRAQQEGRSVFWREGRGLASQESMLRFAVDSIQKRRFRRQANEKTEFVTRSRSFQLVHGVLHRYAGSAFDFVEMPIHAQAVSGNVFPHEPRHSYGDALQESRRRPGVAGREAGAIEDHFAHGHDDGASRRARFSSCWSKKPVGHSDSRPSRSIFGDDTTVPAPRRSK